MVCNGQTAPPADSKTWFFDAEEATAGEVARSISEFYQVSVLLGGSLGVTKVSGRLLASDLPEALASLQFFTGQKWREAPGGRTYLFGGSKEKVIADLPTYGLRPQELGSIIGSVGSVIGDRIVVETDPARLAELQAALKPLGERASLVLEVYVVACSTQTVERVNAWLNTFTLGVGVAAGQGPMAGFPVGIATGSNPLQGVADVRAMLTLLDGDRMAHVELRQQATILSGGSTIFESGQVLEDVTYTTLPQAQQTSGQMVSQITRRTVGLALNLEAVNIGSDRWHLDFKVTDSTLANGNEERVRFEGSRRCREKEGMFLLASFTRRTLQRTEKLVPVLSELKWIGRGFRTAVASKEDRSVMILARPLLVSR